jgi:serine/threonine protein phosphatase 1
MSTTILSSPPLGATTVLSAILGGVRSVYVIGDVHGMLEPLQALMEEIRADAARREVDPYTVFVGDLVDRGADSARVVRYVRSLVEAGKGASVLGNHDEMFLQSLAMNRPDLLGAETLPLVDASAEAMLNHWLSQGGVETIRSYRGDPNLPPTWRFPPGDVEFLASLPLYWEDEAVVVTHALPSREALRAARERGADSDPRIRHELLWRRQEPPEPPDPDRLHVSGHTPLRNPVLHQAINAIQLDTGCVFGLLLCGYAVETGELFSVPCSK